MRFLLLSSFLFFSILCFSQNSPNEKDSIYNVFICLSENSQTFHSHKKCIGLETCIGKIKEVSEDDAFDIYQRSVCCFCWVDPGEDCGNDNPNVVYDEEDSDSDRGVFLEDFLWLDGGGIYAIIGAAIGSVALLSNEVFIGTSYSLLPPRLSIRETFDINSSLGFSFLFRKNFKKDAIEYGFNYHSFEFNTDRNSPNTYEYDDRFMFSISYLHQMNQHFFEYRKTPSKVNFFLGPIVTFGNQDLFNNQALNKLGVGMTGVVGIPLGKKVFLDIRSDITNYSSEVKLGIRWWYQEKYPWQR